ncbi:hypothetical protein EYB25_009368 [Talaromyces marneffei]|nr:hypothetical protein EYB25_009368 [Talaromyces marneffei]
MASNNTTTTMEQFLAQPGDWEKWEKAFRGLVKQERLLDYLDGKVELMQRPVKPLFPEYPTIEHIVASRTEDSDPPAEPTATENATLKRDRKEWLEETKAFPILEGHYKTEVAEFEAEQRRLSTIYAWMRKTVHQDLQETCLGEDTDLRVGFQNLSEFYGRTSMTVANDLEDEYTKHMKEFNSWPKDYNTWISKWLGIMQRGKMHDLTFATNPLNWTRDFFKSFKKADSGWVSTMQIMYSKKIQDKTVTYFDFSQQFQETSRLNTTTVGRKGFQRGAFNTNQQKQSDDEEDDPEKGSNNNHKRGYQSRKGNKNYKPGKGRSGPSCIGCGLRHRTWLCFYLFPFLAPPGFKPKEELQEITKRNLQDEKIKQEVEEVVRDFTYLKLGLEVQKKNNKKKKDEDSLF